MTTILYAGKKSEYNLGSLDQWIRGFGSHSNRFGLRDVFVAVYLTHEEILRGIGRMLKES
jgi:hypothetical protein